MASVDTAAAPLHDLGPDLDRLLRTLRAEKLAIGPREILSAHALVRAHVDRLSVVEDRAGAEPRLRPLRIADLGDSLGPLLATDREARASFDRGFARFVAGSDGGGDHFDQGGEGATAIVPGRDGKRDVRNVARRSRLMLRIAILLALAAALGYWRGWFEAGAPRERATASPARQDRGAPLPLPSIDPAAPRSDRIGQLLRTTGEQFHGAPTLDELARTLAPLVIGKPDADSYARALQAATGLPRDRPIAVGAVDRALADPVESPTDEQLRLSWLNHAIDLATADGAAPAWVVRAGPWFAAGGGAAVDAARLLSQRLDTSTLPGDRAAAIARVRSLLGNNLPGIHDEAIERAIALLPGARQWSTAPWAEPPPAVTRVPGWLPIAAAALPLLLLLLAAYARLTRGIPALRLRAPNTSPLRTPFLFDALRDVPAVRPPRRDMRRLQGRSRRSLRLLDVPATVQATLAAGGGLVQPRYAYTRAPAEYLFLIERHGFRDQAARRALALLEPLRGQVAMSVWFHQSDPAHLQSEDGREWTTLQNLLGMTDRRLVLVGTGEGLLDALTLRLTPAAELLRSWPSRALLTPLPPGEWTRQELEVSRQLAMPIGRATSAGLLSLPALLGLGDRRPRGAAADPHDATQPLPPLLAGSARILLSPFPPPADERQALVAELRRYLGFAGFEWLCAIAFYPALQWHLTLYLGVRLPLREDRPDGPPLYDEVRLAQLTRLPWLRRGAMPAWLRRDLILATMPDRAKAISTLLGEMLRQADQGAETAAQTPSASFVISRESDALRPEAAIEDEVFLDLVVRPNPEDFALPSGRRRLWQGTMQAVRGIGAWAWIMAAALLAAGFVAYLVAPAGPSALRVGGWLPLAVLVVGGGVAAAMFDPPATARAARRAILVAAPAAATILAYAGWTMLGGTLGGVLAAPLLAGGGWFAVLALAVPMVLHLYGRRRGLGFALPRRPILAAPALLAQAVAAAATAVALVAAAYAAGPVPFAGLALAAAVFVGGAFALARRPSAPAVAGSPAVVRVERSAALVVAFAAAAGAYLLDRQLDADVTTEATGLVAPVVLAATDSGSMIAAGDAAGTVRVVRFGTGATKVGAPVLAMRFCSSGLGTWDLRVLTADGRVTDLPAPMLDKAADAVRIDLTGSNRIPALSCGVDRVDPQDNAPVVAPPLTDLADPPPVPAAATPAGPVVKSKPRATKLPPQRQAPATDPRKILKELAADPSKAADPPPPSTAADPTPNRIVPRAANPVRPSFRVKAPATKLSPRDPGVAPAGEATPGSEVPPPPPPP